jgi:hypothetical protein
LAAITRTRAQAARELDQAAKQSQKRKSALGFMLDIGKSSFGFGSAPAQTSVRMTTPEIAPPNRRLLSGPSEPIRGGTEGGERSVASKQQERRTPGTRVAPPSIETNHIADDSGDQLEIPAFLRRQAN